MAEWIRWQRLCDIKCSVCDLEVMGFNPGRVELCMCSTSIVHEPKIF